MESRERPPRYRERFDEAVRLRDSGRREEAIDLLRELVGEPGDTRGAELVLGGLLLDMNDDSRAVEVFEPLVRRYPRSESVSLGLFHSLWASGRTAEAIAELERFLSVAESMDYRRIRKDLEKEGLMAARPRLSRQPKRSE